MGKQEKDLSDQELMILYQSGEERAFEELYKRYSGRIYAYLQRRIHERIWVDDLFQMVFIKLHRSRHHYSPDYRFDQWIFVMTKRVLLDFWKTVGVKNQRFFSQSFEEHLMADGQVVEKDEGALDRNELLKGLSLAQREAIELRYFDDLAYEEIAQKMGRSEESIRQMVSRAIRKIRGKSGSSGGAV